MQDLLARALRDRPTDAFIHPGDLAWWLGWPPKTDRELAEMATLWEADGKLLAWVAIDGDDVFECVDPNADRREELHAEIDRFLRNQPRATRYVKANHAAAVDRLRATGYRPVEGGSMLGFSLDLARPDRSGADPRVRAVTPADDLGPRASVTRAAFEVDRPFDRYVSQYASFVASPAYPHGWDLVAWASPGVAAACAIAWPDAVSGVGNFEPVATHPDHRRRGYGSAVLRDGFRRLRDAGMTRAIVCTPAENEAAIALYRSVGFVEDHTQVAFRKS